MPKRISLALIIHLCSFLWSSSPGDYQAHKCFLLCARFKCPVQHDMLQDFHAQCMETGSSNDDDGKMRMERMISSQVTPWYIYMFSLTLKSIGQLWWKPTSRHWKDSFIITTIIQFKQVLWNWKGHNNLWQLLMFRVWLWKGRCFINCVLLSSALSLRVYVS